MIKEITLWILSQFDSFYQKKWINFLKKKKLTNLIFLSILVLIKENQLNYFQKIFS